MIQKPVLITGGIAIRSEFVSSITHFIRVVPILFREGGKVEVY